MLHKGLEIGIPRGFEGMTLFGTKAQVYYETTVKVQSAGVLRTRVRATLVFQNSISKNWIWSLYRHRSRARTVCDSLRQKRQTDPWIFSLTPAVQWRLRLSASPRQLRSWLDEGGGTAPLRRWPEQLKCVHFSSLTAVPSKEKIVVAALEWQRSESATASRWASDQPGHSSSVLSLKH